MNTDTVPSLGRLRALWVRRDARYALRRPLSDSEVSSIRSWRASEADDLTPNDRAAALVDVSTWIPPLVRGR